MFTAIGPVLIARFTFGGLEVAQTDAVTVGRGTGLIGTHLLGDGLDLEIHQTGAAARHSQRQSAQLHIQRARTPQTAVDGEGKLAINPDGAQQLAALVELGAFGHPA